MTEQTIFGPASFIVNHPLWIVGIILSAVFWFGFMLGALMTKSLAMIAVEEQRYDAPRL